MADAGKRLGWLQALRGIAAVSVVICHCVVNLTGPAYNAAVIDILMRLGAGVDLFFVISGFIMVHTTRADPGGGRSAARFAVKRLQRIWPAYCVLTIVIGTYTFGWGLIDDATRMRLVKSILFVPPSYDGVYSLPIVVQGWTLCFEVYFYAVFAMSLLFAGWRRWTFLAAWWGVTLIVVPLIYHASLTDVSNPTRRPIIRSTI